MAVIVTADARWHPGVVGIVASRLADRHGRPAILVATGSDRVLAKHFSLTDRVPQFLEEFPDARILYMVRDPLEVIPSSMSLVIGVIDRAFGFWSKPEAVRQQWLDRMYESWVISSLSERVSWSSCP